MSEKKKKTDGLFDSRIVDSDVSEQPHYEHPHVKGFDGASFEPEEDQSADVGTMEDVEAIMRKYDRESNTRIWQGTPKLIVDILMALFSAYCIYSTLTTKAAIEIRLTAFMGCIMILGFLTYPASKKHVKVNSLPWYDIVLMILGAAAFFYYSFSYNDLSRVLTSPIRMTMTYNIIGIVGVLVLAELCRRCVGLPILFVAGALLIYTFASGQSLNAVIHSLFYSTQGILSTPVNVCAKFIVVFIIFGAFLERTGIANFFIDLANSVAGSASGGPAKVAVVASALEGMVSGSSVANTVGSGSITIPMMKKTGYRAEFAGAVEAAASTGGQIMPPIMGAAAFLMAEFTGEAYKTIAMRAILPAVLYFTGIYIAVHLEAKKLGLQGIPRSELPKLGNLTKRIYLLLPLVLLVVLVSTNTYTMAYSAALAIVATIVVSIPDIIGGAVRGEGAGRNPVTRAGHSLWDMIFHSLEGGAKGSVTVAVACGVAGIISGCITVTGLASKLLSAIVNLSGGHMMVALVLTMLCCIVLGMGVPTTANYCIMAATCAPILMDPSIGVTKMAAHFFVFYFGIVADITPPVALAAYAGSAIAKAPPMRTALNATKLAIAAFIVPYIFAISPQMLFVDVSSAFQVVQICITALFGIFGVAAALNGYLYRPIPLVLRLAMAVGGLCMMIPGTVSDIIGFVLVLGILLYQRLSARRAAAA